MTRALAAALLALLLAACAAAAPKHSVSRPLVTPVATTEFFITAPEVRSRESDDDAQRRNREWAVLLADTLRSSLERRGGRQSETAAVAIVASMHIVYRKTKIQAEGRTRWEPGFVEVQLELRDTGASAPRYATFSKTPIKPTVFAEWFGWGPDADSVIRQTIAEAVERFYAGFEPPR